jgi:hypothetical protein
MADNEKPERETLQSFSDNNDPQYATSFKLAAIMLTINLSTMVAALDLVRARLAETFHADDQMNNADQTKFRAS